MFFINDIIGIGGNDCAVLEMVQKNYDIYKIHMQPI